MCARALPSRSPPSRSSLAGCGGAEGRPGTAARVVATTTQVADLARDVAGDRAAVRGLLAPNADPHDHEVRPAT